jgi:hypothetical protein
MHIVDLRATPRQRQQWHRGPKPHTPLTSAAFLWLRRAFITFIALGSILAVLITSGSIFMVL